MEPKRELKFGELAYEIDNRGWRTRQLIFSDGEKEVGFVQMTNDDLISLVQSSIDNMKDKDGVTSADVAMELKRLYDAVIELVVVEGFDIDGGKVVPAGQ